MVFSIAVISRPTPGRGIHVELFWSDGSGLNQLPERLLTDLREFVGEGHVLNDPVDPRGATGFTCGDSRDQFGRDGSSG